MKTKLNCNERNITNRSFHPQLSLIRRQNRKIILSLMLLLTVVCSGFSSACEPKKVDYQEFSLASTKDQMVEAIGSEPNEQTKDENGGTIYEYSRCVYENYTGKMQYYYAEDALMYSKWNYKAKDEKKMKETYEDICSKMKEMYGKGEEAKDGTSTTYTCKDKYIIVAYTISNETYMVCITDMMK